jgi:hypothetical protein
MSNGVYLGLVYSEGRHKAGPTAKKSLSDDHGLRSIVKSILVTLERAMYVARQLQYAPKPGPHMTAIAHELSNSRRAKPRTHPRQTKEIGNTMQTTQPNLQTSMEVGEIDFQMICRYLELSHAEIRRIMKRNRMTLRSGAFKGDGKAAILRILLPFTERLLMFTVQD